MFSDKLGRKLFRNYNYDFFINGRSPILPSLHHFLSNTISEIFHSVSVRKSKIVTIKGWVRSSRLQKNVIFLDISDGSCLNWLQVVVPSDAISKPPTVGSSIQVSGQIVESRHSGQAYEIHAEKIRTLGDNYDVTYPFQSGKRYTLDYIRQFLHLRARTNVFGAVMRVRSKATILIHKYFQDRNYINIHSPIITASDCEGAGDLFTVKTKEDENIDNQSSNRLATNFFDSPVYLTVSGQLHAETMMSSLSHVYTFGPAFRAEKSHTRQHLAEFYMIEVESSSADNMTILMNIIEQFVKDIIQDLLIECADDIGLFRRFISSKHKDTVERFLALPCVRMTYSEAIAALTQAKQKFQTTPTWGDDLHSEHEKYLIELRGCRGIFVTDYPAKLKPFYCRTNDDDNSTVAAVDLLLPFIGELAGGSLREERSDKLLCNIGKLGISKNSYSWYIDLRKYGTIPHGGFGMGFERFLQFVLGVDNIRDVIPFPRYAGSCKM